MIRLFMAVMAAVLLVSCETASTASPPAPTERVGVVFASEEAVEAELFFWHVLNRDGEPQKVFECTNRLRFEGNVAECVQSDGKRIMFSAAVPLLVATQKLP